MFYSNTFFLFFLEEVREENKILVETKEMLEDQLESSRKRCGQIMSIENELYKYKAELHNCQLECENDKKRIEELEAENLQLQMSSKSSISESQSILAEMENIRNKAGQTDTNILTEQLGEGMSRIHKLELENNRLRQENEDLKLNKFHADSQKMLALETENKKLSLTIQQLQKSTAKDVETNASLQTEIRAHETKSQQFEQKIAALKEATDEYRIEKETEIENLNRQVDSMKKRQEKSNNEQIANLESENKKMVKEVTLLETKVNKLERENKQATKKFKEAKEIADKVEDYTNERERLKSELEALRKENEELNLIKESHDTLLNSTEEIHSLNKKLLKLEDEKTNLFKENMKLKQECSKNAKNQEIIKANTTKIQLLESERDDLRDTINKLNIKVETLTHSNTKLEDYELELTQLKLENKTLQRSNTSLQRKIDEVSTQSLSLESENHKFVKTIENLRNSARSVETLEKEIYELESKKDELDRDNKSLAKQVERLKQQMEEKALNLEDLSSKFKSLEREKFKLVRDLEQVSKIEYSKILKYICLNKITNFNLKQWEQEESKLDALERENRELSQSRNDERKAAMNLREDLVKERMKSDQIQETMEGLHKQLKQLGLDPKKLDADAAMLSNQRIQNLEGKVSS